MSKEKQIEEMAKDLTMSIVWGSEEILGVDCWETAMLLCAKGYRKQSEGENIGTVHPVDEFVCSNCGIAIEGWTKVVTDEDDGEQYHYEYEFRYCPNCGAKMKGGDE